MISESKSPPNEELNIFTLHWTAAKKERKAILTQSCRTSSTGLCLSMSIEITGLRRVLTLLGIVPTTIIINYERLTLSEYAGFLFCLLKLLQFHLSPPCLSIMDATESRHVLYSNFAGMERDPKLTYSLFPSDFHWEQIVVNGIYRCLRKIFGSLRKKQQPRALLNAQPIEREKNAAKIFGCTCRLCLWFLKVTISQKHYRTPVHL